MSNPVTVDATEDEDVFRSMIQEMVQSDPSLAQDLISFSKEVGMALDGLPVVPMGRVGFA